MQSRLIRSVTKDRARAGASAEQILEWPIERVIMAHGAIIEDEALPTLRSALHWMLEGRAPATAQLTA